jgi:hypothetical protein
MAVEELREVSTPLDDTEVVEAPDTGADDGGSDDGGEQQATPVARQATPAKGPDGKFQKVPRAERRAQFRDTRKVDEELGTVKGQLASLQAQYQRDMTELRRQAQLQQQAPQRQAGPTVSPAEQRLATLKAAMASEVAASRSHDYSKGAFDTSRYEKLKEEYDDARLEARLPEILRARGIDLDRRPDPNQRPMGPQEVAQAAADTMRRETLFAEAPWLKDRSHPQHQARYDAFLATIQYLEGAKGRPRGVNTDREAAAMVEAQYGIQSSRAPQRQAPRAPVGDNVRGGGMDDGPGTLEVPSSQLEGLPPHLVKRVAQRMRGGG